MGPVLLRFFNIYCFFLVTPSDLYPREVGATKFADEYSEKISDFLYIYGVKHEILFKALEDAH